MDALCRHTDFCVRSAVNKPTCNIVNIYLYSIIRSFYNYIIIRCENYNIIVCYQFGNTSFWLKHLIYIFEISPKF